MREIGLVGVEGEAVVLGGALGVEHLERGRRRGPETVGDPPRHGVVPVSVPVRLVEQGPEDEGRPAGVGPCGFEAAGVDRHLGPSVTRRESGLPQEGPAVARARPRREDRALLLRPPGEDLDDAPDRIRSVETRAGPPHDLDPVELGNGQELPGETTAGGRPRAHPVDQNQNVLGAGSPEVQRGLLAGAAGTGHREDGPRQELADIR